MANGKLTVGDWMTKNPLTIEADASVMEAIHTLREKLAHTGPHIGCETSHCGACTVDLDGMSVKSCTVLTVQCQASELLTIEGFEQGGALHALFGSLTATSGFALIMPAEETAIPQATWIEFAVMATAGAIGGFIYWMIAGREAGLRRG